MPAYSWSCLSCGSSNPAKLEACAACACPASCSYSEMQQHRAQHLKAGGTVGSAAGLTLDASDYAVLQAPVIATGWLAKWLALLLLFGWPVGQRNKR